MTIRSSKWQFWLFFWFITQLYSTSSVIIPVMVRHAACTSALCLQLRKTSWAINGKVAGSHDQWYPAHCSAQLDDWLPGLAWFPSSSVVFWWWSRGASLALPGQLESFQVLLWNTDQKEDRSKACWEWRGKEVKGWMNSKLPLTYRYWRERGRTTRGRSNG